MALDLKGSWRIKSDFILLGKVDDKRTTQEYSILFDSQQDGYDSYAGAYLYFHGTYTDAPFSSSFLAQVFTSSTGTMISMIEHNDPYYATYCGYLDRSIDRVIGSWADVRDNKGNFQLYK